MNTNVSLNMALKEIKRVAYENLGYENSTMTENEAKSYCSLSYDEVEEILKEYLMR